MLESGHDASCHCERCPPVHARRLQALNAMHARLTIWTAWLAGAAIVVSAAEVIGKTLLG